MQPFYYLDDTLPVKCKIFYTGIDPKTFDAFYVQQGLYASRAFAAVMEMRMYIGHLSFISLSKMWNIEQAVQSPTSLGNDRFIDENGKAMKNKFVWNRFYQVYCVY